MPASTMACFYAAPLAWNPTGVDIAVKSVPDGSYFVQFGIGQSALIGLLGYGVSLVPFVLPCEKWGALERTPTSRPHHSTGRYLAC